MASRRTSTAGINNMDDTNNTQREGSLQSTMMATNPPSGTVSTYARIRPLLKDEAKKVPDYHPIPRPAVITCHNADTLDPEIKEAMKGTSQAASLISPNSGIGKEMVVVMDPDKKFARRKGGAFAFTRVFPSSNLNEYEDPPVKPLPVASQSDIFADVRQIIENTCSRLNSCVIVCGGSKSGKMTTMFGDIAGTDPEARGILPRFASDIFRAINSVKAPNAEIKTELEFVEVMNDNNTVTDLLLSTAERATAFPIKIKDEGHSLVTLTNATRAACSDGPMMLSLIKQGLRQARKKDKSSHLIVNFRVSEKAEFEHPQDSTQKVTKVSRFWTQFVLISGNPTPFVRCIDIAAQRDSGQSNLKVPVRDSMVTRICSEAFGGNCDTHCVVCASPFFSHAKDAFNSLEAVSKFSKVKTRAIVSSDNQTSTFRKLHDEMAGLSTELKQTTQAQDLVQQELDERQSRLEKAASSLEEQQSTLSEYEKRYSANEIVKIVKALRLLRLRRAGDQKRKQLEQQLSEADERLQESLKTVVLISTQNEDIAEQIDEVRTEQSDVERVKGTTEAKVVEIKRRSEELVELRKNPAELKANEQRRHDAEMEALRNKKKEEEDALKKAEERREAARQKEVAVKKELEDLDGPYRRLEEAKKKNEELEKEKEDLDADNERLELEIAQIEAKLKQPDGCGCVIQ